MDGGGLPIAANRPRVVHLRDSDHLAATMRLFSMESIQLGPDDGHSWMMVGELPHMNFTACAFGANVTKGMTRAGQLGLHLDLGSDPGRKICGMDLGRGDFTAALGTTEFELLAPGRHRGAAFSIPQTLAMEAMEGRAGGSSDLRHGRLHLVSGYGDRVESIRRVVSAMSGDTGDAMGHPQLRQFASGALLDSIVSALLAPWHRDRSVHVEVAHYQRMPIVRRVEAFMRANLDEPLMLHQICAAARASERAVEYAFQDVYGMGAKQYLRLLRFHMVRRQLKAMPPQAGTVIAIAQQYGFWHTGHFSTGYRRLFGETAQQTRGHSGFAAGAARTGTQPRSTGTDVLQIASK
jgi:AraC family ethanolamine operon transcriptional activator